MIPSLLTQLPRANVSADVICTSCTHGYRLLDAELAAYGIASALCFGDSSLTIDCMQHITISRMGIKEVIATNTK